MTGAALRCCAVERGCQHPPGEGHVYCPFHGAIVSGYPQPTATACHREQGWEPSEETQAILRRAQDRRHAEGSDATADRG